MRVGIGCVAVHHPFARSSHHLVAQPAGPSFTEPNTWPFDARVIPTLPRSYPGTVEARG